jgi:hypothetical protein
MSAYVIHIEHREEKDLAWVEINYLSQESRSARRCRFQTIGWILDIVDMVNAKVDPRCLAGNRKPGADTGAMMPAPIGAMLPAKLRYYD